MNKPVDVIVHYSEVPRMPHLIEVAFQTHDSLKIPLSTWVNLDLKVGLPLLPSQLQSLETESAVAKAKDDAYRYLNWKPRTANEVAKYLQKKQYEPSVTTRVVSELEQAQIIDDAAYASLFVQQKSVQMSRVALSWKLSQRGLGKDVIQSALNDQYPRELEEVTARGIAQKFDRKYKHLPLQKRRRKLGSYLQRQGFSDSLVRKFVYELLETDVDDGFLDND